MEMSSNLLEIAVMNGGRFLVCFCFCSLRYPLWNSKRLQFPCPSILIVSSPVSWALLFRSWQWGKCFVRISSIKDEHNVSDSSEEDEVQPCEGCCTSHYPDTDLSYFFFLHLCSNSQGARNWRRHNGPCLLPENLFLLISAISLCPTFYYLISNICQRIVVTIYKYSPSLLNKWDATARQS